MPSKNTRTPKNQRAKAKEPNPGAAFFEDFEGAPLQEKIDAFNFFLNYMYEKGVREGIETCAKKQGKEAVVLSTESLLHNARK